MSYKNKIEEMDSLPLPNSKYKHNWKSTKLPSFNNYDKSIVGKWKKKRVLKYLHILKIMIMTIVSYFARMIPTKIWKDIPKISFKTENPRPLLFIKLASIFGK